VKRSRVAWLAVAIALLAVVLVLFLPARWVAPLAQSRLHGLKLEGVRGLVWDGEATALRGPDGRPLGAVRWQLSRSALWRRLDLQIRFDGPLLTARGHLRRDAQGRPVWSDVTLRSDLAAWSPRLDNALGEPRGMLAVTLQRVVLQANWPVDLEGQAQWRDAVVQVQAGPVALGDVETTLHGTGGVLGGEIHDLAGGPLHVEGQWQASPLGWRLDLLLQPRTGDPALRHWLARLGRPDADGAVHLQRRGGLAAATPEPAR
jgi:general secretion pathway protein N